MPNGNKENDPLLTDYLWKNYASELNERATKNNEITEVFPKVKFIDDEYFSSAENFNGYKKVLLKVDAYKLSDGTLVGVPREIAKIITP